MTLVLASSKFTVNPFRVPSIDGPWVRGMLENKAFQAMDAHNLSFTISERSTGVARDLAGALVLQSDSSLSAQITGSSGADEGGLGAQ